MRLGLEDATGRRHVDITLTVLLPSSLRKHALLSLSYNTLAYQVFVHVLKSGFVISFPFNVLPDPLKYHQPL